MKKALFVSERNPPTLQVVWDEIDRTYSVYSSTPDFTNWELNAQGRLMNIEPIEAPCVDLRDYQSEPARRDQPRCLL